MPGYKKIDESLRLLSSGYVKINDSLKTIITGYRKVNGELKVIYETLESITGYNIGDAIITGESIWQDSNGADAFTLLDIGVSFSAIDYPELALVYPSLTTPTIPIEAGSVFPYKIAGDLQ